MNVNIVNCLVIFSYLSLVYSVFLPNSLKDLFLNNTFANVQELMKSGSMNGYLNYSEFEHLMKILEKEYSEILDIQEIGTTFQQRKMFAMKFGRSINNSAILFTGMHHSREPVSFLMNVNIMLKILYEYTHNNTSIKELINTRNIYFIPVVNIDGFVENVKNYDETGKYSKIRKNRRNSSIFDNCSINDKGVDLNRNYDYKFGLDDEGSDSNYCLEAYRGEKPFSEPETQAIKAFVESHPNIKIALNYHSFGNLLIIPFNFDYGNNTFLKNNLSSHYRLYQEFKDESGFPENDIMGNGRASIGYPANGEASDWMLGVHGILSFSPELGINGEKKLFGKFYPNIKNAYEIIRANMISSFYVIQKTGYFLKIQPIKKLYIDCISNSLFTHQKIPFDDRDKENLKFCNDELYEFSASLAIQNIGLNDLNDSFPLNIEVISKNMQYFILSISGFINEKLSNLNTFEKNLTQSVGEGFNISASIESLQSKKHVILELKFYLQKKNFTKNDFVIRINSERSLKKVYPELIFNSPNISLSKKDFDFFRINNPNSKKGTTTTETHDMIAIVYIFIGFIVLLFIMFLFTLKKVRDFFNICPDEDFNAPGRNSVIRRTNNTIRFQRVQSDFEISTYNINSHSINPNASVTTESSELNSLT